MAVDSGWVSRNLGVAVLDAPATELKASSDAPGDNDQELLRSLIEFDSEGTDGAVFREKAPLASTGLSKFVDIDWPAGLEPKPGGPPEGESLPRGDVLVVTWTVDEGHALSRVLSPGHDSKTGWKPYTKNFKSISKHMRAGCPAIEAGNLGTYWTTEIGKQKVTLFKSGSHMSQDGPQLANALVWKQIIEDVQPSWVISTGTGGGIGPAFEVGDVIVSRFVTFDCRREFKHLNDESFACAIDPPSTRFEQAQTLFGANAKFLPSDNKRPPSIITAGAAQSGILTTDFFGFDNTDDTYKLEGKGDLSEMGDAVLGMVCQELGTSAPNYTIVRNVSDPQIDSSGMSIAKQAEVAADIYKGYGRWSTVCSAITCWSIIASLP